jgi:hypothetical protein
MIDKIMARVLQDASRQHSQQLWGISLEVRNMMSFLLVQHIQFMFGTFCNGSNRKQFMNFAVHHIGQVKAADV